MTGICGWLGPALPEPETKSNLSRMAAGLPVPGKGEYCVSAGSALCGRLGPGRLAQRHDSGLSAIIDGEPRWTDNDLEKIAKQRGHGQALLTAYEKYGHQLTRRLFGTFAFAVIDEKADELTLGVDRLGIQPLCHTSLAENRVIFGSTTDALIAFDEINPQLSAQSIYDYVYFHVIPSPATIYSGIAKLEPGQIVVYSAGNVRSQHYWNPEFTNRSKVNVRELQAEIMSGMRNAVGRYAGDESTATFLSGGLDSSTVSGLANELTQKPVRSYTIGFAQDGYDEIEYARVAAEHFKLDLREYYVTPDDVADAMDTISTAYDEPFGNSSAIPALFCARRAKADGVNRLLAGDGGDELFAGNERYAKQRIFEHYWRLPRWLRTGCIEPTLRRLPMEWSTLSHKVARYVEQAQVPMPERLQTYNLLHMKPPGDIFAGSFLEKIDVDWPITSMEQWYAREPQADLVNRMLLFDWKLTLADNDLRKVNRMCSVAGIDVAYPLLDDELVEISTRIPSNLKLKGNQLRYFFRETVSDYLPPEILQKQKHGFGLPFGEWLKSSERLTDRIGTSLEKLKDRGIFRTEFIDELIQSHRSDHAAFYGNIIWVLVMLQNWLEHQHQRSTSMEPLEIALIDPSRSER
jgi:asparagine synthase (glutamine-hydrolysing)